MQVAIINRNSSRVQGIGLRYLRNIDICLTPAVLTPAAYMCIWPTSTARAYRVQRLFSTRVPPRQ